MESDCRQKPSPGLVEGIGQFNRGDYYECHETLEGIRRDEPGKIRDLYKGILQIGRLSSEELQCERNSETSRLRGGAFEPLRSRMHGGRC